MSIVIDAPQYGTLDRDNRKFVMLADDLHLFTRMWFYSDLSYAADLNPHLQLALDVRHPFDEPAAEPTPVPVAVQRRLMLPFRAVKNLRELRVTGTVDAAVEKELRAAMAVPYDSPERCLEEAARLKDEGNTLLKAQPRRALELYLQAFEKVHVINEGRKRSIWADAWFHKQLRGGPYDGQYGQGARVILRVKLVANVLMAFVTMKEWDEAQFWGRRTISLVRSTVGADHDEPIVDFGGAPEMGKIYFRTGLACKHLGNKEEARRYFRTAQAYLPHDSIITTELESLMPRLI